METAGVDVGLTAPCPATASVVEVVNTDRFCVSANILVTGGTASGTEGYDRFECRLIRMALWVLIRGCGCKRGLSLRL